MARIEKLDLAIAGLAGAVGLLGFLTPSLLLGGWLARAAEAPGTSWEAGLVAVVTMARELGLPLPWALEVMLEQRPDRWALLLGLVGAAAVLALGGRLDPLPRRVAQATVVALPVPALLLTLLGLTGCLAVVDLAQRDAAEAPRQPGEAAAIAGRALTALRASLPRQAAFTTPGGVSRRCFAYGGPGVEPLPAGPLDYARQHALPALCLLPWGPPGNADRAQEEMLFHPADPPDVAPAALDRPRDARTRDALDWADTHDGTRAPRFPAVLPAGDGYGYAFQLMRTRRGPPAGREQDQRSRPFDDGLCRVVVSVFEGFDPAAAAAAARGEPLPRENIPVRQFVTLVAPGAAR